MILMRCTETIEEVDERNGSLQRSKMRNGRKIHDFLHGARTEHGETCLAAGHHILMVTEDTERMTCECTCRDVEHTWQKFTGNLVHVRNHQEQTL